MIHENVNVCLAADPGHRRCVEVYTRDAGEDGGGNNKHFQNDVLGDCGWTDSGRRENCDVETTYL